MAPHPSSSPGRGRARLTDVAQAAGVSTATVSLVLRDRPGPSEQARAAVHAAAEALGYRPDRTASLLARRRSHLLGVLFDVTSPFHAELVAALDEAAGDHGLDLVLSSVTPRRDEASAADLLLDFRCEGLLLLGPTMKDAALADLATRVPTVVVGRHGVAAATGLLADDAAGLGLAVDHLVHLGHRRITYLDGPRGSIATARAKGYRDAMRRHGLTDLIEVVPGGPTEEAGAATAHALLDRVRASARSDVPSRRRTGGVGPAAGLPSALISFNDRCAIGARDALLRSGLSVPGDVSVVGYDDSPPARLGTVDLTTVSQDPAGLARATVATVAAALAGKGAAGAAARHTDVVIEPRLVVRGSTSTVSA